MASNPKTIQSNYNFLSYLGFRPQQFIKYPSLLNLTHETIQDHYDQLLGLGISSEKLIKYAGLLQRDPIALERNLQYLTSVNFDKERVLEKPQLLAEQPDAVIKKMRILKLDILGLQRRSTFNPNDYISFWSTSPATLLAKRKVCRENGIVYKKCMYILRGPWVKLFQKIEPSISSKEAKKRGRELTEPLKKKYDEWMKEYKIWAGDFANRRNRRIIKTI